MATIVLVGLIYIILELYIDDIIIHGRTEDEFIHNIRSVFGRFRDYKLTLSPRKCVFGATQIDFVGHVISADGITFSKKETRVNREFYETS